MLKEKVVTSVTVFSAVTAIWSSRTKIWISIKGLHLKSKDALQSYNENSKYCIVFVNFTATQ